MFFTHSPQIWSQFPALVAGVTVAEGVHPNAVSEDEIQALYKRAKERLAASPEGEGQLPEIQAWRKAYSSMGLKPTQYRCAAESLLRRLKKDEPFPRFHPLVDFCNALSMAYATPIAVIDAAKINGGITVRHAAGNEQYLDFSGAIEAPEANEVIFADEAGHAHSRRWCFRQSKESVCLPGTATALIVAEAHHASASADVAGLLAELSAGLAKYWKTPAKQAVLTPAAPKLEF
jgi:DNA/RNA-binding domain of Phe-tRNA-synthetase-like protein